MKKALGRIHNYIIEILAVLLCIIGNVMVVYGDTVIPESEFEDSNLYNYVIENFDTDKNGQLETSEAEAVTDMVLNTRILLGEHGNIDDVTSLKGLEHFVNLNSFSLQGDSSIPITDLSPLKNLTKLEWLAINQQWYIEDFSVLSGLVNLEHLDLWNTNCGDVSFLKNMIKLEYLAITDGKLKNTEAIAGLTNLEVLDLYNCGLKEVSFVVNLNKLQRLHLSDNDITDFSPLINIKETLVWLTLGGYDVGYELKLENLAFLTEMKNLEFLSMAYSHIEEIPDLTGLTKLSSIYLGQNYLTVDDVINKLPVSITSQENWIQDSAMDAQREKATEVATEPVTEQSTEPVTEIVTEQSTEPTTETVTDKSSEPTTEKEKETKEGEESTYKTNETVENSGYHDIQILGEFDCEVYLIAEEKRNLKEYDKIINKLMKDYENAVDIQIYNISACDVESDEKVQPNEAAKISLAFDEVEGCEYIVFELAENGEYKEIRSYLSDGKLHFYTENINSYMVITMDESGVYEEKGNDSNGLFSIIVTGIGVMVVLVGGGLVFIIERRKK